MSSENCVLGVEDYTSLAFAISPTPNHNIINIESKGALERVKIFIARQHINEGSIKTIDVSAPTNGLYFAQGSTAGKTLTKKFIKF